MEIFDRGPRHRFTRRALLTVLLLSPSLCVFAQSPLEREVEAFVAEDRAQVPATGGIVFVGSSSIRMWRDLPARFPGRGAIVNRGFGGSLMADCARWWRELVLPHRPRQVVVYAGENDLAAGRTPEQVADSFRQFADAVSAALPGVRITYVSMKPSPQREALMPAMRAGNVLIGRFVRGRPGLDQVDVFDAMLDAQGRPRAELFRDDGLHMNAAGYALWQSLIAPRLL